MMGWLAATVELPRWVVWGALLTTPALWSRKFKQIVSDRLPGGKEEAAPEPSSQTTREQ